MKNHRFSFSLYAFFSPLILRLLSPFVLISFVVAVGLFFFRLSFLLYILHSPEIVFGSLSYVDNTKINAQRLKKVRSSLTHARTLQNQ